MVDKNNETDCFLSLRDCHHGVGDTMLSSTWGDILLLVPYMFIVAHAMNNIYFRLIAFVPVSTWPHLSGAIISHYHIVVLLIEGATLVVPLSWWECCATWRRDNILYCFNHPSALFGLWTPSHIWWSCLISTHHRLPHAKKNFSKIFNSYTEITNCKWLGLGPQFFVLEIIYMRGSS